MMMTNNFSYLLSGDNFIPLYKATTGRDFPLRMKMVFS